LPPSLIVARRRKPSAGAAVDKKCLVRVRGGSIETTESRSGIRERLLLVLLLLLLLRRIRLRALKRWTASPSGTKPAWTGSTASGPLALGGGIRLIVSLSTRSRTGPALPSKTSPASTASAPPAGTALIGRCCRSLSLLTRLGHFKRPVPKI